MCEMIVRKIYNSFFLPFEFYCLLVQSAYSVIRVKMRESKNYAMCELFRITYILWILWSFDLWHLDLYFLLHYSHTTVLLFVFDILLLTWHHTAKKTVFMFSYYFIGYYTIILNRVVNYIHFNVILFVINQRL